MTTDEKKEAWESFLTDEEEAAQQDPKNFIQPNIETKLPAHKRKECRDIVMEIKKFGVSQRQLLYLIYLLSLELEDVETMRSLAKVIGEKRERIPLSITDEMKETPSIILLDDK
jgi:hypothetical protein